MFDIEKFRAYCLKKKGVTEEFPFGGDTLVYKVMGKMFALTGLDAESFSINLKCESELMEQLRSRYPAVQPGYHMSKTHWNTVMIDGSIPQKEILMMIDHSYDEVVKGMPKKLRQALENL
jgi:predicted DNA-binding protein (MmcQ/YjbR family)